MESTLIETMPNNEWAVIAEHIQHAIDRANAQQPLPHALSVSLFRVIKVLEEL
jgi:hypothetical protein